MRVQTRYINSNTSCVVLCFLKFGLYRHSFYYFHLIYNIPGENIHTCTYMLTYVCTDTVFVYDVTDIIDCVLNTKRGVFTLVGEIRRYRNVAIIIVIIIVSISYLSVLSLYPPPPPLLSLYC